jgi:hypothetical protein
MKRFLCGLVALGLLVGGVGQASGQPSYVFTTIAPPGSASTYAYGINNAGQVSGQYEAGSLVGLYHGFLYSLRPPCR